VTVIPFLLACAFSFVAGYLYSIQSSLDQVDEANRILMQVMRRQDELNTLAANIPKQVEAEVKSQQIATFRTGAVWLLELIFPDPDPRRVMGLQFIDEECQEG
jgi:hypothetical protein